MQSQISRQTNTCDKSCNLTIIMEFKQSTGLFATAESFLWRGDSS